MAEDAKWYVVHTYSGYENKVASNLEKTVENRQLQELIQEIRVPTEQVTEITDDGRRKEVERKIFPGYVIVKMIMTDESWYAVRNIRGCTGFVGPSSKPIPLTEAEVARLAEQYGLLAEQVKTAVPAEDLKRDLALKKASELVLASAKVDKAKKKAVEKVFLFVFSYRRVPDTDGL